MLLEPARVDRLHRARDDEHGTNQRRRNLGPDHKSLDRRGRVERRVFDAGAGTGETPLSGTVTYRDDADIAIVKVKSPMRRV
jgi:hypothetical protein